VAQTLGFIDEAVASVTLSGRTALLNRVEWLGFCHGDRHGSPAPTAAPLSS